MVNHIFGGDDVERRVGKYPRNVPTDTLIKVYADAAGTNLLSVVDEDGDPITSLTVDDNSQVPLFGTAADILRKVYISVAEGPLTELRSQDYYLSYEDIGALPSEEEITALLLTKADKGVVDAHIANTSNPHGVTKAQLGLSAVNNTSDADKPLSDLAIAALGQKAAASDLAAHTGSTANPHATTKAQVGLANVDNTSDLAKPLSTAATTALGGKADTAHMHTASQISDLAARLGTESSTSGTPLYNAITLAIDTAVNGLVNGAPGALDQLNELATAIGNDPNFATTLANSLAGKQPLDADLTQFAALNPGTNDTIQRIGGVWASRTTGQFKSTLALVKSDISGISNVDNTSDVAKPLSTAAITALAGKQPFDQDLTDIAAIAPADGDVIQRVGASWTSRTMTQMKAALSLVKGDVGLGNVDNTSDLGKPISIAQQAALDVKAGTSNCLVFTTTGSSTWTKPAGLKFIEVTVIAGGGGGGSGRRGADASVRSGGGGGSGAAIVQGVISSSLLADTESVVVGTGGTGGIGRTTDATNGAAGTAGGISSFGSSARGGLFARGGGSGAAGGTAAAAGGTGGGGAGGASSATAAGASGTASNNMASAPGAGAGGTITAANAATIGGDGGFAYALNGSAVATSPGVSPTGAADGVARPGRAGGGGTAVLGADSGNGGNGSNYGAGGGGGAGSQNGFLSGAGGNGAQGIVVVVEHF